MDFSLLLPEGYFGDSVHSNCSSITLPWYYAKHQYVPSAVCTFSSMYLQQYVTVHVSCTLTTCPVIIFDDYTLHLHQPCHYRNSIFTLLVVC